MATTSIALFSDLNKQLKRENFQKCVDICHKLLIKVPGDEQVLRVQSIALIRMGKFKNALEKMKGNNKSQSLQYERAYCHYRLKEFPEALKVIQGRHDDRNEDAFNMLEAQTHFRMGSYDKCIQIYEKLLSDKNLCQGDVMEISTNLLAAYTAAEKGLEGVETVSKASDGSLSYELLYNQGCSYIQARDFKSALKCLIAAEAECTRSLTSDGFSEDEIRGELEVIVLQQGFVWSVLGNPEKALSLYRQALKTAKPSSPAASIATNNIIAIKGYKENVFDSFKRLKGIGNPLVDEKLTSYQQESLCANRALLMCMMNKGSECREVLEMLEKAFPDSTHPVRIQVSLLLREKRFDECVELLCKTKQKSHLTLAHVHLLRKCPEEAAAVLKSMPEVLSRSPGGVATVASIYDSVSDTSSASDWIQSSIEFHNDGTKSEDAISLMIGDAKYKLKCGKYQEAADAFTAVIEDGGNKLEGDARVEMLASRVIALSHVDAKAAEAQGSMLPPLANDKVIDAQELEASAPRISSSSHVTAAALAADVDAKKKERKRLSRNPEKIARKRRKRAEKHVEMLKAKADYNPSIGLVKPDPERWIPRKQRSGRGRRGRNKFVGAQGAGMGTAKDAAKLDAAARANDAKNSAAVDKGVVVKSKSSVSRKSKKKKRR